jgi:hypothetical protein
MLAVYNPCAITFNVIDIVTASLILTQFVTLSEVSVTRSMRLIAGRVQGVGEGLYHEAACQGSGGETSEISCLVVYQVLVDFAFNLCLSRYV